MQQLQILLIIKISSTCFGR